MRLLGILALLFSGCMLVEADREVGFLSDDDSGAGPATGGECTADQQCGPGQICFNNFCVGSGQLRISLAFGVDSDYDLHVMTPSGAEIWYQNRRADGGYLDVDQCITPCGAGTHVENVYFETSPQPGTYQVWVVNFDGRSSGAFSVESSLGPLGSGFLSPIAGEASQVFTLNVGL